MTKIQTAAMALVAVAAMALVQPESRPITWIWSEPTSGTPVDHYVGNVETWDLDAGDIITTYVQVTTKSFTTDQDLDTGKRLRVAGVDSLDRQGPYSNWSDVVEYASIPAPPDSTDCPCIRQTNYAVSVDGEPVEVVLDYVPTEGNVLVAFLTERSTTPVGSQVEGFEFRGSQRVAEDPTYRRGVAVWTKVVGANESQTVVGYFDPIAGAQTMTVVEVHGVVDTGQLKLIDNGETPDAVSLESAEIITTAPAAIIVLTSWKPNGGSPGPAVSATYTNGFLPIAAYRSVEQSTAVTAVGFLNAETGGAYSTTPTIVADNTANVGINVAILSFNSIVEIPDLGVPGMCGVPVDDQ